MKKIALWCAVLFILAMLLPDLWVVAFKKWPDLKETEYNLWWDSTYNQPLNALWYLHGFGSGISKVLIGVALILISKQVSIRFTRLSATLTLFYITQFFFWLWNKNTSIFANFIVYIFIIPVIVYIVIPEKAKIIHLNKKL